MRMTPRRVRALSLVEALMGAVILFIGLVPLVHTFRTGMKATQVSKEHTQAMFLADSVMEDVRARVQSSLGRYYRIADDAATVRQRADSGAWKSVFLPLAETRRKVVSQDPTAISTYFAQMVDARGGGAGPITREADPVAFSQLACFSTEVLVGFDVEGAGIDSDADARSETDMCEVRVKVFWGDPSSGREASYELASLFSLEDYDRALGGP